jgi:hypothetical protein
MDAELNDTSEYLLGVSNRQSARFSTVLNWTSPHPIPILTIESYTHVSAHRLQSIQRLTEACDL